MAYRVVKASEARCYSNPLPRFQVTDDLRQFVKGLQEFFEELKGDSGQQQ